MNYILSNSSSIWRGVHFFLPKIPLPACSYCPLLAIACWLSLLRMALAEPVSDVTCLQQWHGHMSPPEEGRALAELAVAPRVLALASAVTHKNQVSCCHPTMLCPMVADLGLSPAIPELMVFLLQHFNDHWHHWHNFPSMGFLLWVFTALNSSIFLLGFLGYAFSFRCLLWVV